MNKVAYLDNFPKSEDAELSFAKRLAECGNNSGNLVFRNALSSLPGVDTVTSVAQTTGHSALISSSLIWIRENEDNTYFKWLLDNIKKPIVLMSVGLQSPNNNPDFQIHPELVSSLKRAEERCASIGVRGYYTAEILNKFGIKKIKVIGCPSVYKPFLSGWLSQIVVKKSGAIKAVTNAGTLSAIETAKSKEFLSYIADKNLPFVEQTPWGVNKRLLNDAELYAKMSDYLTNNRKMFLSTESWRAYTGKFNFAIGMRFHGNIMALWAGVPALFITIDSRTREMCDFFKFPTLDIEDFNGKKSLSYYRGLADYTRFNNEIPRLVSEYMQFLIDNGVLSPAEEKRYEWWEYIGETSDDHGFVYMTEVGE